MSKKVKAKSNPQTNWSGVGLIADGKTLGKKKPTTTERATVFARSSKNLENNLY